MCLLYKFSGGIKQESQFTVRVGGQKLMHSFVERHKDYFNFPFQLPVSDRLDNSSAPVFCIICPSYISSFFQAINNSCNCTSCQASQLTKPPSWHGSKTVDKVQTFMVSNM